MGNSKSVIRKLNEKSNERSKRFDCFALLGRLKCFKTEDIYEEIDFDEEPPKRKVHLREVVMGDDCLLHEQAELLKNLKERNIDVYDTKRSIDDLLKIAKELRATGYKISDECLINIILGSLDYRFNFVLKEIYDSKSKLTIKLLRWKILERANTEYLCYHCKHWSYSMICGGCEGGTILGWRKEIRNGKDVEVLYNCDLTNIE